MGHGKDDRSLVTLLRRLCHWGPFVALFIIKFVFFTCIYLTSLWLPPYESVEGTVNYVMYMAAIGLIMYNFLSSVALGGGFVPEGWRPVSQTLSRERRSFLSISQKVFYPGSRELCPLTAIIRFGI